MRQRGANVSNSYCYVVNSRPALFQKLSDWRLWTERFEEFDMRLAYWQHSDTDALLCYLFSGVQREPKNIAPNGHGAIQFARCDSNVVDIHSNNESCKVSVASGRNTVSYLLTRELPPG